MPLPAPITSRQNARVKELRASLSGEARRPGDLLGLEGEHLIEEAHRAGMSFATLYVREGSEPLLETRPGLRELRVQAQVVLSRDLFDSTVSTRTPKGVAATCILREPRPAPAGSNTLVLEQIQDPGNLGTLLRSAETFGVSRVMATPGTANEWNPKVLRAGAGAVLRTAVERAPLPELLGRLRAEGTRIFAAVAHITTPFALAAPHGVLTGRRENAMVSNEPRDQLPAMGGGPQASLSYDTDFLHPCAILIGNEGAGLSEQALSLADELVMIPGGASESLNAAVAGSILMYESMRQVELRVWGRQQGLRP